MPSENLDALVDETKALWAEVEAGNTDHAAWIAIQDRVRTLTQDRSQAEAARLLGRDATSVGELLRWDRRSLTPWSTDSKLGKSKQEISQRSAAKTIMRDPKQRSQVIKSLTPDEIKSIAVEAVKAAPEAAIDAIVHDDDLADDTLNAALDAQIAKDKATSKRPKKPKTRSALDAWGGVISAAAAADFQAKKALESIQSADEAVPDDLLKDASKSVDHAIASWELVAATIAGDSVGDQAEAFLAEQ